MASNDQMGSLADQSGYMPFEPQQPAVWPNPQFDDLSPAERAAYRTRQSVQPVGGRTEAPGQIVGPVVNALVTQPVNKARGLMQTMADYSANEFPATMGATAQTTDYDPRSTAADYAAGTAFNLMGAGYGMTPENAVGIFGGRLAKTADWAALEKAEAAAAQGVHPEQIWKDTGWFQAADKHWKFEIPDASSKWTSNPSTQSLLAGDKPLPMGQAFEHPELYEAYPQLRDVELGMMGRPTGASGSYKGAIPSLDMPPRIDLAPGSLASMRSTNLHELQHGVQDIEGYGRGGNTNSLQPGTPAWDIYQERLQAMRTPLDKETYGKVANFPDGIVSDKEYKDYLKIIKKPNADADRMAQDYAVNTYYKRLAGEVEARNVQKRAGMSPDDLATQSPLTTQDYPNADQFVRWPKPTMSELAESRDTLAGFEPGQAGNTPSVATNIVKYNEGSPFLKTDKFHGFSGLRTGKPVNEMEYQITGEPKFERPVIDPQSLIGKELIFAAGDRSTAGGVLQSVGGTKLTRPQPMEGGADYAFSQADKPIAGMSEDARRMWANASPQTSGLINLGNEVLARGREPVLMYQAMAKHSVDSSKQMALPAYDLARQSSISNAGASFINKAMEGVEGFPGWRSPKLHDWLSNTATGTERGRVVKAMDSEVARDAGFPDLGELRYAITNPHLRNTPTGSVGLTISPFEPGLGRVEQSLHSTYPTAVAARGEPGTFGGSVPWHVAGPDLHANLMKYGDPVKVAERPDYYSSRMPVGLPRTQLVTPRVADSISEWMYRNPKLWGSAAAAPGFGALAAQDNYQQ